MGNEQSGKGRTAYERRDWERQVKAFQRNTNGKLSVKDFKAIQEQIAFEYPALASVHESMLVTDNRLPDCPIVYANDQFERMTLYPKEVVLGINCRFLQGPLTDKGVVRQIGDAVRAGRALDVELLNYRKDGVPFWNIFLMLPVHKKGQRSGEVEFFLAVQKDVSVIKGLRKNAKLWSAPEVCMWLERVGLGHLVSRFLDNKIEGHMLPALCDSDLRAIGVKLSADRDRVLAAIASDFNERCEYLHTKEGGGRAVEKDVQVVKELDKADGLTELEYWGDKAIGVDAERMTVKCTFGDRDPVVVLVPDSITVKELKKEVQERIGRKYTIEFEDEDGDAYPLKTQEDLETALALSDNQTLALKLSAPQDPVKGKYVDMMSCISAPVLFVDAFGVICFANEAAMSLFGEPSLMGRGVEEFLTGEEGEWQKLQEIAGSARSVTARCVDGSTNSCSVQVQLYEPGLAVVTIFEGRSAGGLA